MSLLNPWISFSSEASYSAATLLVHDRQCRAIMVSPMMEFPTVWPQAPSGFQKNLGHVDGGNLAFLPNNEFRLKKGQM